MTGASKKLSGRRPNRSNARWAGGIAPDPATYVLEKIMMPLVPFVGVAPAINGTAACREVFAAADQDTGLAIAARHGKP